MKKTLVALAVLAASGASFAQVTLSGQYIYEYDTTTVGGNTDGGFGIADADLVFKASEDLGGGMTASAQMKLSNVDRNGGVTGGDSMISVSSGMGTVSLGRWENNLSDNTLSILGDAVGGSSGGYSNDDTIRYSNNFGPVSLMLQHAEPGMGNNVGTIGAAANAPAQKKNTGVLGYASGPLSVTASYTAYSHYDSAAVNYDSRTDLGGSYDFGPAALAVNFSRTVAGTAGNWLETQVNVSVPLGALSLGIDYANTKIDDATAVTNGTATGFGVQAVYSLSKRTSLRARVYNYDAAVNPADRTSRVALAVKHTF